MKKLFYISILFFLLISCSYEYEPKAYDKALKIIMTSDIHFIDKSLVDNDIFLPYQEKSDGKLMKYNEELIDAFIEEALEIKPDIVIITGDLTFNGEYQSHITLSNKLKKLKDHKIEVLLIPGNHDILNTRAIDYSSEPLKYAKYTTLEEYKKIYQNYGLNNNYVIDSHSLSYIFKASDSLYLIMLDSNDYEHNTGFAPSDIGLIKDETLKWLDEELAKLDNSNFIIFSHHPILDLANNEHYKLTNSDDLIKLINKYQIKLSISGHIHASNYLYQDLDYHRYYNYGISSLMVYDHQYTILDYDINNGFNLYTKDLDMENYALSHNIDDDFFIDFKTKAYDNFKYYSTTRMKNYFHGDDIDPKLSKIMLEMMGDMNCYEFSGEAYKFNDILKNHPQYVEIYKYRNSYSASFFDVIKHFKNDSTKLNIKLN